jgi:hypothetical protein
MYVYLPNSSESHDSAARFTVGFFDPNGLWQPESDHASAEAAADRAHYMNGGTGKRALERQAQQHNGHASP